MSPAPSSYPAERIDDAGSRIDDGERGHVEVAHTGDADRVDAPVLGDRDREHDVQVGLVRMAVDASNRPRRKLTRRVIVRG